MGHGYHQRKLCRRCQLHIQCLFVLLLSFSLPAWTKPLDIELSGVDEELLSNVQAYLSVEKYRDKDVVSSAAKDGDGAETITRFELRRLHRRAADEISKALQPFGYYQPQIESRIVQDDERWLAQYKIEPGPRTTFDDVIIRISGEGKDLVALQSALADISVKSGDPLIHSRFESAKDSLYDTAYGAGFLLAKWQQSEIRVRPEQQKANLTLVLETGPRFYFGEVTFEQNVLHDRFLHRFVKFSPGEPYNTQKLLDLQLALGDTQYFDLVEVTPMQNRATSDHHVPIAVRTSASVPQEYTIGAGFGTDTGPRIKFGAVLRRINKSGHRIRSDLRLSSIESAISARYEIPVKNVVKDTLAYSAVAQRETVGDAETDQFALAVSLNDDWLGFRRRASLTLQRENFQFGEGVSLQSDLLFPGITLTRERADNLLYPRRGYSLSLDLRGAAEGVLSDATFARFDVDARWVRALGENTRILTHAGIGVLDTSSFTNLPPSQRFFTGGDRSIRGYDFESLGERNAAGAVIGGEYRVLASFEFEHLFYKDYGAAVFVDTGDAFRDSLEFNTGAGIGARWRSPIGMVRLDFAHPFDDPDNNFRIHISIGPDL